MAGEYIVFRHHLKSPALRFTWEAIFEHVDDLNPRPLLQKFKDKKEAVLYAEDLAREFGEELILHN